MIIIVLPDIPSEDRLLEKARQGNREALMQIYESYFPPIYNFIRLRVDDLNQAEDMASEVFVKLVEAMRGRNAPHHSLRGWLFRVARNQISDYYGRNRQLTSEALDEWVPAPTEDDPEAQFMRSTDLARTRRALRMLAPDQQEVLLLRFNQGLNLQETADVMGRNISAIKSLQFRAIDTLRKILGELQLENSNG
jgi:RNA polymerase sigma-70 factor, ECF subfamily